MEKDITNSSSFEIRYSYGIDYQAILNLVEQQKDVLPVTDRKEAMMFARNWNYMGKYKASLTLIYEGEIVGFCVLFLMPYKKTQHLCQGYVMIDSGFQGQGVEQRAIKNLEYLAKENFKLKKLYFKEVDGSYLIPFLENAGYGLIYRQEKYVKERERYLGRGVYEKAFEESVDG